MFRPRQYTTHTSSYAQILTLTKQCHFFLSCFQVCSFSPFPSSPVPTISCCNYLLTQSLSSFASWLLFILVSSASLPPQYYCMVLEQACNGTIQHIALTYQFYIMSPAMTIPWYPKGGKNIKTHTLIIFIYQYSIQSFIS